MFYAKVSGVRSFFFAARAVLARLGNTIVDVELKFSRGSDGAEYVAENVRLITRFLPDYSLSLLRSGLSAKSVRRLASDLTSAGYFEDKPWLCEPVAASEPDVVKIANKLLGFDGYRSWRVSPAAVASFISQFPPSLRQPMLQVLTTKLDFISAQRSVELIAPLLAALPKPCHIVPFSSTSGHQIWTWLKKELSAQEPEVHFTADVLAAAKDDLPIVFVDDNASSGVQACAQFLAYFGIPRERWPAASQREAGLHGSLDPDTIASLQKRRIFLVVCAGRGEAGKVIGDCLLKEGIDCFSGFHSGATMDEEINWPSDLKKFLTDVGRHLIAQARFGQSLETLSVADAEDCEYRAFGYGNVGALLFTSISVPTATVTALWQPGLYRGQPWVPLAIRTDKLKHLVIG